MARYQRTASTITSDGKRKPAKAEQAMGAERWRRVLMPAVSLLKDGHRERNSTLQAASRRRLWRQTKRTRYARSAKAAARGELPASPPS
jgi:hypothetical protein